MPELPEVETIRRGLKTVLTGKKIKEIKVLRDKSFKGEPDKMKGWIIEDVGRKAKVLEVYFKNRDEMVIIHLKMTGQLVFLGKDKRMAGGHPTKDWVGELPSTHTRVIWEFTDGTKLFFNDMRVFGWMKMVRKDKYIVEKKTLAPDVIDEGFSFDYLKSILLRSKKAIKLVLLDQDKVGGVGNIYANDALYLARIKPDRQASSLSDDEIKVLRKSLTEVINRGIKYGGSSAADEKFVNVVGEKGSYQEHFLVYEREGDSCKRDGGVIKKIKIGGRGTYFCPNCQK